MMVEFTYCRNFATAEERSLDWAKLCANLTRSVEYPNKEASKARGAFIGGVLKDAKRNRADDNIAFRTVATIDFDAIEIDIDEVELQLRMNMPCAYVAYSTFRHTPDRPRIRLCVPLSRRVGPDEYKAVVDAIVALMPAIGPADKCSWVWAQLMFLASHQPGVEPWSLTVEGEPWQVADRVPVDNPPAFGGELTTGTAADDGGLALERALAYEPLDLTDDAVDSVLERWPAEPLDYDQWLEVGAALWHQYRGEKEGFERWVAWSEKSPKHDAREMRSKWNSFGGRTRPKTMASIIKHAGGLAKAVELVPAGGTYAELEAKAKALPDMAAYIDLRDRVRAMNILQLPVVMRSALALAAHESFGKDGGMTKAEVKRDFQPRKARRGADAGLPGEQQGSGISQLMGFSGPDWLLDWVYCEADATFERVTVRHSIKREAFRAKYDRRPEVVLAETDAATFALNQCNLPTVANLMYWPGEERLFETEGLLRLNTYVESGVGPCDTLEGDEDGQKVVALFMDHVRNTVATEREQRILIDFMAFVLQNPGMRVRWALLLHGIEGNGKSFFYTVMQMALGLRARVVSTTAINSDFTGWAEGALLIGIEEIRIAGTNKYAILDKMKPLITNDTIAVVAKRKDEKTVPNFTSYMMFTNHADAIPVGDNDRRYCVISTRHTTKADLFEQHGGAEGVGQYFERLFSECRRRADALARFLLDWEISAGFDAAGRAPETEGLVSMRGLHVSEDRDAVEAAIEDYAGDVISLTLLDVTELNKRATMDGRTLPAPIKLNHILSDMGLSQITGRRIKLKNRENHYVWFNRKKMSETEAKKAVREYHEGDKDFSDVPF